MSYELQHIPGEGELSDAFAVRRTVFIDGQNVPESVEIDGKDDDAFHVVMIDSDTQTPVGTARLRIPKAEVGKPERVAVLPSYRGQGIGRQLMEAIEVKASNRGCTTVILHAQKRVVDFYETLEYRVTSDEFEEAGIPHVEMQKEL